MRGHVAPHTAARRINKMRTRRYQPFKARILAAVVIANLATMAGVMALPRILPEPAACRELREAMGALERLADREKAVTGHLSVTLRLAGGSGLDVIREHEATMASLRKSTGALAGMGNPYKNNMLIASVIALIATQAFCLFAFILATASDVEEEADAMSRLIDEMLRKERAKEKELSCCKN